MPGPRALFESMGPIWVLWVVSLGATLWLTQSALHTLIRVAPAWVTVRHRAGRAFHRAEDGASYSLIYVMVVPIYALFVCTTVETTWMLIAKLGTTRAAYAAARSSIVHATADGLGGTQAREAAVTAFSPFASGMRTTSGSGAAADPREDAALRAYWALADQPRSAGYVRAKFRYAATAVRVALQRRPHGNRKEPWRDDIAATVTYRFPFRIGAVGRFLGQSDGSGRYVYPITSTVVLPIETPRNETESLGIDYPPFR